MRQFQVQLLMTALGVNAAEQGKVEPGKVEPRPAAAAALVHLTSSELLDSTQEWKELFKAPSRNDGLEVEVELCEANPVRQTAPTDRFTL